MIKAIKLFLLKRRIGYKPPCKRSVNKYCRICIAYKNDGYWDSYDYCDRYKFAIEYYHTCDHFVHRKPLSEKERAELEKAGNRLLGIVKGMIDNFG
ncbi:MAG: hypothetical protein LBI04_01965, partial [Treponema sp.]|nr:hypothetical protein [Treponema sp.]